MARSVDSMDVGGMESGNGIQNPRRSLGNGDDVTDDDDYEYRARRTKPQMLKNQQGDMNSIELEACVKL